MAIRDYIEESILLKKSLLVDERLANFVNNLVSAIKNCFLSGNKVLIAGNGGSAADAQHFAAEFIGRYKKERKGYPVIALTTDTSAMTAWSNDYSFETLFAREIESLGKPNDVFIGLSTSGNSQNIIKAVAKAKKIGVRSFCLLGKGGGDLKSAADSDYIVPSDNVPRIQESHTMILHVICDELEQFL